jgi:antitoxin ParD1/3/4
MATMKTDMPGPMKDEVEGHAATDPRSNAGGDVRKSIRRDQKYHEKREELIEALINGEKSGFSERSLDDIWRDVIQRHG